MDKNRNLILAGLLTVLLFLGWDAGMKYFYPQPAKPAAEASQAPAAAASGGSSSAAKPTREGGLADPAAVAAEQKDLAADLASPDRVAIDTPMVHGSINLHGALLDDLTLSKYRETEAKDSPPVRLFSPAGTPAQYYGQFGWVGEGVQTPDAKTLWQADGTKLTPQTPVTLKWTNNAGQTFAIRFAVDQDYMVTTTQSIANAGAAPVVVKPFALVNRTDKTASIDTWTIHSGPIGAFDGSVSFSTNYKDVTKAEGGMVTPAGKANWIGFTDIYWLSALVPDAGTKADTDFRTLGSDIFRADLIYAPQTVAPGASATTTTRLFAGAKENAILEKYESAGIPHFSLAIDWGWFRWFEKPIFALLDWLFKMVGNFGVAIIALTVIVRGLMFPVAQRQFASMAQMRAVQPKMKAIQERYKDDKQKQQEEIMKLYREEKVNPLGGCLPMFLQVPVFFALYKVLMLTIEMRHQPFVLWIHDLSAPDPLHILNLFGLLPFTPPSFLGIGILALMLGVTMWAQFKLNPTAGMDPAQAQMMGLMPWFMMFVMAPFAAGLLIYWITSNLLTIAQQKFLYSRHPQLKAQAARETKGKSKAG
ncbi:MAG: membrane protein insertase YidC [Sphingomonadales bacterium]|nr:membrane protein insertase YidC [Sphingomonadales bacterium]MDE2570002.1 membrane protein insertase YidC [Sphingomonadales bacterium]